MTPHALRHYPAESEWPRWLIVGFVSGAVSVLLFHQGLAALLHTLEWIPRAPYSMTPTKPWGVPQLWSIVFWGGIWGVLLAASFARLERLPLVLAATVFGALLPTLLAWFFVAPLKGQPVAAGGIPMAMLAGVLLNGAWGLGTGIGLALFGHPHAKFAGSS
jgi:hypothetical protein